MPKQKTREEMAEYQRTRRAALRRPEDGPDIAGIVSEDPSLLRVPRRDSLQNPFADGMPDTPQIIQSMSQRSVDAVLLRAFPARARS